MSEKSEKKPTTFENWLLVVVLLAVLSFTVGPIVAGKFSRQKVLDGGVMTEAKIVNIVDTNARFNSDPVVTIELLVAGDGGEEFPAKLNLPLSPVRLNELQVGKTIPVKYDPNDRTKITLVTDEDTVMPGRSGGGCGCSLAH